MKSRNDKNSYLKKLKKHHEKNETERLWLTGGTEIRRPLNPKDIPSPQKTGTTKSKK